MSDNVAALQQALVALQAENERLRRALAQRETEARQQSDLGAKAAVNKARPRACRPRAHARAFPPLHAGRARSQKVTPKRDDQESVAAAAPSALPTSPSAGSASPSEPRDRCACQPSRLFNMQLREAIQAVTPNAEAINRRNEVVTFVRVSTAAPALAHTAAANVWAVFAQGIARKTLGAQVFYHGSFALRTFLPSDPIDLCAFFSKVRAWRAPTDACLRAESGDVKRPACRAQGHEGTWAQRFVGAICQEAYQRDDTESNPTPTPTSPSTASSRTPSGRRAKGGAPAPPMSPSLEDPAETRSTTTEEGTFLSLMLERFP
jgi:hypothetical protein